MRDWNDPAVRGALYRVDAPHETAAVLRLNRAGYSGPHMMQIMRVRATQLMAALQKAMDLEQDAYRRGLPIHDSLIERGTK